MSKVLFFILAILPGSLADSGIQIPSEEEYTLYPTESSEMSSEDQTFILSNISIDSFYEENPSYRLIRMNISWPEGSRFKSISIREEETESNYCYVRYSILENDLKKGFVVQPSPKIEVPHDDKEFKAGCVYVISFLGRNRKQENVTYEVPECVGKICSCQIYKPEPKILAVEHESEDTFLVTWDPGSPLPNGKSYNIVDITYYYRSKNSTQSLAEVEHPKNNFRKNFSKLYVRKIPKDEEYILRADFKNNFNCFEYALFEFEVHEEKNYATLLFLISAMVVIIIALKYQELVRYGKKLVDIPKRYGRVQQENSNNVQPNGEQRAAIEMIVNPHYSSLITPVEFLSGELDKYEFPRNMLKIIEKIGSGAFGQVYSAKAFGITGVEEFKIVAVKTYEENALKDEKINFMAEIEIFKKIGVHPNIVRLLGCCTLEEPYMMIMEFAPCGDLKKYLLDLREQWIKKQNTRIFFPDNSDGIYITPEAPASPTSPTSSHLPLTTETMCTILDEDGHTPLLEDSKKSLEKILDHNELQNFALQIAKGMAHLESIPITHRDLAARNILINEYKTLKISDFGMSRKGTYVNHRLKNRLPLRWMSIEAFIDQKYDCKSDVWSFGVVLWEIATLGAFPYEKVQDSFVIPYLQMGRRLDRPAVCTDELYQLMMRCWAKEPEDRPSFKELTELLDVKKRKVYVDFGLLNPTYVFPPSELNARQGSGGDVARDARGPSDISVA